jgi:hypothetical protein
MEFLFLRLLSLAKIKKQQRLPKVPIENMMTGV